MKNSRGKEAAVVASGILLGVAIAAPAAGAALTAQQSTQKIVVDGQPVQIEAYSINGSNYCKLRDVGKAVGFHVSYDALTNTVRINTNEAYEDETAASGTVKLPTDGSQYVPQAGDRILCNDGTEYEIKDVSRLDNNVYQAAKLPALPAPSCDWSKFPTLTLPEPETRHYHDQYGDDLFMRNVYEVRRMVCTIYNALGEEPSAWRDGKPLATVETIIPPEYEAYTAKFWPWNESNLTDLVHSRPNSRYFVDAFEFYHDGVLPILRT
ncbi:MAG: hypothetical protein IKN81_08640 [Oscillospiraceae bacterium]|nr:hypothetical protein [Oscillospiraceae bacterium]